jgi:hypothetical protein
MKQYIRDILNDLKGGVPKDVIPEIPKVPTEGKTVYLNPPALEPAPEDLDNQILSNNAAERVKQLDYQAQESEQKQTIG